jgi:hypothetical protein
MISLEDILNIDHCEIEFFDHYNQDHPSGNHLYYGELTRLPKTNKETVQGRLNDPEYKDNDLYLIPSYMQYGDYDNSCMVERSNRKLFLEKYNEETGVFTISGGYGSAGIAISIKWLMDPGNEEKAQSIIDLLNGLNDYPAIDDEDMSNMEYEAFLEALDDYEIQDFIESAGKKFNLDISDYDQDKTKELILEIDRNLNYPSYMIESGGICYVDTDRLIAPLTLEQLKPVLTDYEVIE